MISPKALARVIGTDEVVVGAFMLGFAVLAFAVFEPASMLTLDAAIKWLQAQSLVSSGYSTVELSLPGGSLDPMGQFLPFEPPHVFWSEGKLHGIFPSSVALLNSLVVPYGIAGVAALSVFFAGVLLRAVCLSVEKPRRLGTVILLAAGTPLWFYSILPWEHVPALALSTSAAALILRNHGVRALALAGLLVGAAGTLRDECLILAPVLVSFAIYAYGWRRAAHVAWGCLIPVALLAVVDTLIFQRPVAAHLRHAVGPLSAIIPGGVVLPPPPDWSPVLRYQIAVVDWVFGFGPQLWLLSVGLIGATAITHWMSPRRRNNAVLIVTVPILVLLCHDLKTYTFHPDFVGGLLRISPALAFAALPVAPDWRSSLSRRFALVATVCFMGVVLLTLNTDGGPQLGPRLLLPILPFLALASWEGLSSYRHSPVLSGRLVWRLGLAAVLGSMAMQVLGGLAYYDLNSEESEPIQWVRVATERVLVVDSVFSVSVGVHGLEGRSVVMAAGQEAATRLARIMKDRGVQAFALVAREHAPDPEFPGFTVSRVQSTRFTRILHWTACAVDSDRSGQVPDGQRCPPGH